MPVIPDYPAAGALGGTEVLIGYQGKTVSISIAQIAAYISVLSDLPTSAAVAALTQLVEDSIAGEVIDCAEYDPEATGDNTPNGINVLTIISGVLGSREANVLDMTGWDETGTHDNAGIYQALINQAATAGVPIVRQAGLAVLTTPILVPPNHVFRGEKAGSAGIASTFLLAHTGDGFYANSGQFSGGITIRDMATRRQQPAVVSGTPWTPLATGYDINFGFGVSECDLDRIMFQNATKGLLINGGDNRVSRVAGQAFQVGMRTDWSYDTMRVDDVRFYAYWSAAAEVEAYMLNNLAAFELYRVDNAFYSRLFSIWHQYGMYIGQYPGGGGSNLPAGSTSKLHLQGADFDLGSIGYYVAPGASGHTARLTNVTAQGPNTPTSTPLLWVEAPNAQIDGDFQGNFAGGNVARLSATAAGSTISAKITSNSYNQTGAGFPALENDAGTGLIEALPGSRFANGNGAAVVSGTVKQWASA